MEEEVATTTGTPTSTPVDGEGHIQVHDDHSRRPAQALPALDMLVMVMFMVMATARCRKRTHPVPLLMPLKLLLLLLLPLPRRRIAKGARSNKTSTR